MRGRLFVAIFGSLESSKLGYAGILPELCRKLDNFHDENKIIIQNYNKFISYSKNKQEIIRLNQM